MSDRENSSPYHASRSHLKIAWQALLVSGAYYLGSRIGFALTFRPYAVSTLWPTNAILLAVLVVSNIRIWPFLILAVFPTHLAIQLHSDIPIMMSLCWFVSNTLEALIGAGLIKRFLKAEVWFESLRDFNLFLFFATLVAPFLSSFLDAAFVTWNEFGTKGYWEVWTMRFFSNVLAGVTVVPVIVAWSQTSFRQIRRFSIAYRVEAFAVLLGLSAVTFAVFCNPSNTTGNPGWIYLPLPFLLWIAARFEMNVLSTSILIVALIAIWGSIHDLGPFHVFTPEDSAFYIQMFVIVFAYPLLLFASLLAERKKIRTKALEGEERFRQALTAANMSTWDIHVDSGAVSLSKRYKQIVDGKAKNDYLNLGPNFTMHPEDAEHVSQTIAQAIEEGKTYEIEFRVMNENGQILWRLGKGEVLFNEKGEKVRILGANVDITARKKAEEERRRAEVQAQEQLQELNHLSRVRMLGELSGTVAHELNQPLTAILSNAQAAQRYLKKETIDINELRQIVDDVIDQDKRAGEVIKRMRTLLKKGQVERRPVHMNDLVKDALNLANSEFLTHHVQVFTDFQNDLPVLHGDRIQLQQVFLNLLINAVEAMMHLHRTDRKIKISTAMSDSMVQLSVTDCGAGIPEDTLNRMFEPFHTTKEQGLGLGLAISRAIVVAHGGYLRAKNNVEGGATFSLSLPVLSN